MSKTRWLLVTSLLLTFATPADAAREDVVHFKNGDRLTCEVKELNRGQLKVTTDNMGTVHIDWTSISRVEAAKVYEVELEDGTRYYGELRADQGDGVLRVAVFDHHIDLPTDQIVLMTEIKRGFFQKLDGSIDLGFNYKKANNDVNYTIGARVKHRTRKAEAHADYSSILSDRDNAPRSFRNVLDLNYIYFLKNRWYIRGLGKAEQNDELGLDLRTNLGAVVGKNILRTNRSRWVIGGGLITNREQFITQDNPTTSLEASLGTAFEFFTYGDLGADLSTNLSILPSLTDSGRYRVEFDLKYRHEIVLDLFVSFSGWYSYDSRPPVELNSGETSQEDYGIVTSLGWEF